MWQHYFKIIITGSYYNSIFQILSYFIFFKVTSIEAEFFHHQKNGLPFFEGWETTLKSHFRAIPSIPDGGYTRGHFLEFTYGNIIMRETITSEVFHEHSYIGSGSLGIISENMLRRIFGNIPFESATVAAIILPRLRPRVWEEKKMTSFQEKFASIPSEYRSYYPQPHNMDGSGPDTIICNKKRGRPA